MPPATIFAKVERSGRTPKAPCAPPGETRKPVTTSSRISSVPARSVAARSACRNSGRNGTCPKLAPVGSRITAATSPRASSRSTAGRSPGGASTMPSATPASTPGVGVPSKWLA